MNGLSKDMKQIKTNKKSKSYRTTLTTVPIINKNKKMFLCILFIFVFMNTIFAKNGPILSIPNKIIDLGIIKENEIMDIDIVFSNTGYRKLVISDIRTSCGCTTAKLEKKKYRPGESGIIKVTFNPKGYSKNVIKRIAITSNSTDQPRIIIKIKAYVEPPIIVSPKMLYFRHLTLKSDSEKTITLTGSGIKKFNITGIHIPSKVKNFVDYKIIKDENSDVSRYYVIFHYHHERCTVYHVSGVVRIFTDVNRTIEFPMAGTTITPIQFAPKLINESIDSGAYFSKTITLSSVYKFNILSIKIKSENSSLKYKIVENKKNHNYSVIIFMKRKFKKRISGIITINTNISIQKTIIIPISLMLKKY